MNNYQLEGNHEHCIKNYIVNREHHQFCRDCKEYANLAESYKEMGLCPKEHMTRRFELLSSLETSVLLPDEKICVLRTVKEIPDCFTEDEWVEIFSECSDDGIGR